MKKIIITVLVVGTIATTSIRSYASDWDVAGKVFAGIEGLRILTGGNVDIIGTMAGIKKDDNDGWRHRSYYKHRRNKHKHNRYCRGNRVWVPHYIWKKKYIPEHTEYSEKYGEIVVEAHYIKYRVEKGGKWTSICSRD